MRSSEIPTKQSLTLFHKENLTRDCFVALGATRNDVLWEF